MNFDLILERVSGRKVVVASGDVFRLVKDLHSENALVVGVIN